MKNNAKMHMKITFHQQQGPDIVVDAVYNETLQTLLSKLNEFRAPDNQILNVYNKHGKKVPLSLPLRGDAVFFLYPFN